MGKTNQRPECIGDMPVVPASTRREGLRCPNRRELQLDNGGSLQLDNGGCSITAVSGVPLQLDNGGSYSTITGGRDPPMWHTAIMIR